MRKGAIVIGLSCSVLTSASAAAGGFPDVKQRGSLRVLCVADAGSARYFSLDPKLPGSHTGGVNILYADGSVRWVPKDNMPKLR